MLANMEWKERVAAERPRRPHLAAGCERLKLTTRPEGHPLRGVCSLNENSKPRAKRGFFLVADRRLLNQLGLTCGFAGRLARGRFSVRYAAHHHILCVFEDFPIPAAISVGHDAELNVHLILDCGCHGPPVASDQIGAA